MIWILIGLYLVAALVTIRVLLRRRLKFGPIPDAEVIWGFFFWLVFSPVAWLLGLRALMAKLKVVPRTSALIQKIFG